MSILNVNTIQPIGSGTTVTVAATELKTSNFITVGTGASITSPSANVLTLGTNSAERLRITSAGLIGIGTVSPSGPIHAHVASGTQRSYLEASAAHSFLRLKSGSTSYNSGLEFFSGASNIANVNGLGAGGLQFEVNGSERFRIDSSGRILIGRTSTSHEHPLQVQAASGANAVAIQGRSVDDQSEITFYENDNSTILGQIQHLRTHSTYRHRAGYLRFDAGGVTEKMRLDSGGRLGLGVVPEGYHANNKAVIRGDSGYAILGRSDNALNISQNFYYDSSDAGKYIANGEASVYQQTDGQHVFYSAVSGSANAGASLVERLRITNAGLVGINDTSPDANLSVGGSTAFIDVGAAGGNRAKIGYSSNDCIFGVSATAGEFLFKNNVNSNENPVTAGTTRMRITGSGHVLRPTMAAVAVTLSAGLTTLSTFNGSYQSLAINSEGFDNANNYNTSNYRFTAPETGFYQVGCNVQLEGGVAANTNSWMYLYPTVNGSAPGTSVGGNQADFDPRDTHYYNFTYTTLLKLSQNDYVQWKYTGNLSSIKLKGQGETVFYFYQVG